MITRNALFNLEKRLGDEKVITLLGPRQAGKTTLLKELVRRNRLDVLWWNGDEPDIREMLTNPTSTQLKSYIGRYKFVIIDEAQRVENIGLTIKLIYDNIPGVKVIATGSSSFELANRINEPLTGRKWEYFLFPVSYEEMVQHHGIIEERRQLEQRLIYGYYPGVVTNPGLEKETLHQLADSYLYKDILTGKMFRSLKNLKNSFRHWRFNLGIKSHTLNSHA